MTDPLEPLSAAWLADVRREHRRAEVATPDDHVDVICGRCYIFDEGWPCDTIRLVDALETAAPALVAILSRGPREVLTSALLRGPGRYSRSGSQALAERLLLALEDSGYVIGEARP